MLIVVFFEKLFHFLRKLWKVCVNYAPDNFGRYCCVPVDQPVSECDDPC